MHKSPPPSKSMLALSVWSRYYSAFQICCRLSCCSCISMYNHSPLTTSSSSLRSKGLWKQPADTSGLWRVWRSGVQVAWSVTNSEEHQLQVSVIAVHSAKRKRAEFLRGFVGLLLNSTDWLCVSGWVEIKRRLAGRAGAQWTSAAALPRPLLFAPEVPKNSAVLLPMIVWALCPTCCLYPACLPPSTKSAAHWDTPALEVTPLGRTLANTWSAPFPSPGLNAPVLFCHSRVVGEDDGLSAGLQRSWKVHGGKRRVYAAHPSGRLCPSESTHKPLHTIQDAHEAHLQPEAMDAHLPRRWGDAVLDTSFCRQLFTGCN